MTRQADDEPITRKVLTEVLAEAFAAQDARLEKRFDALEACMDGLEELVSSTVNNLATYIDERFAAIDRRFDKLEYAHSERPDNQAGRGNRLEGLVANN